MLLHAGMLLLGLVLLYFGAEWLVKGAAGLARAMGVRPLVVGLTVVAYGTSAPELVVSVLASLEGRSAIALGNVIGSNIANIGAILGVTALIHPPRVESTLIRRELPVLMASTLCIPLFLLDGRVSRLEGVLLLVGTVGFTFLTLRLAREIRVEAPELRDEVREEVQEEAAVGSRAALVGLSAVGLVGLVVDPGKRGAHAAHPGVAGRAADGARSAPGFFPRGRARHARGAPRQPPGGRAVGRQLCDVPRGRRVHVGTEGGPCHATPLAA